MCCLRNNGKHQILITKRNKQRLGRAFTCTIYNFTFVVAKHKEDWNDWLFEIKSQIIIYNENINVNHDIMLNGSFWEQP